MQENKFLNYKGKKIFYRSCGKGHPVVLLHGLPFDGSIWKEQAHVLQEHFHLIIPDMPGSGRSEMLEDENISIDDYSDVVKSIIDNELSEAPMYSSQQSSPFSPPSGEIEGAEVTMVGHSIGGYITLAFAEKYPGLLNRFGLFHSSAFADDEEKKLSRRKTIEFVQKNGADPFLKTMIPNLFAGKQHLKKMGTLVEGGNKISAESLIQYYYAMIDRPDRTRVLKTFNKPVLFIIGEKDTAIPVDISLQQCHLPAISFVHILKDSGHLGMIEESKRSTGLLLSFLQNI